MNIHPNELRIGNFVLGGGVECYIHAHDIYRMEAALLVSTPILLTPEILERCGFTKEADGNEYRIGLPLGNGTDLVIETVQQDSGPYDVLISDTTADEVPKRFSYLKPQKYLHQLQNLYFAVAGKELEIKI